MVTFIVWIVFIRLRQKTNLNHIKSMWNKDFCGFLMSSEGNKILKFHQDQNLRRHHLLLSRSWNFD